ncbi:MAG: TetR/AcrR family transcriptional regulator [Bradyrhizobium sp.]|nr:TetR/AcrR family transcriptional regulator [Bradyrhizobium sp.]
MNEQIIIDCDLPGVRPAHQRRTRELMVSLVNEGLALLKDCDFDSLSIETICERCDTTVGSFYARFESKEVFVTALQRLVAEDSRINMIANYQSNRAARGSLPHLLAWISKGAVTWYQRNEGLVRACLRRAGSDPAIWTPMRELGELQVSLALPQILALLGERPSHNKRQRVRFAFQIMHGTLNNMVLINPGPFSIHHPNTGRMLATAMLNFIEGPS